jgi:hypothetical protein
MLINFVQALEGGAQEGELFVHTRIQNSLCKKKKWNSCSGKLQNVDIWRNLKKIIFYYYTFLKNNTKFGAAWVHSWSTHWTLDWINIYKHSRGFIYITHLVRESVVSRSCPLGVLVSLGEGCSSFARLNYRLRFHPRIP